MKITFNGHQQTERQVELTQQELFQLFEVMKESLLDNVEYGQFDGYSFYNEKTKKIMKLCETHNVDVAYTKDRLAFFTECCPFGVDIQHDKFELGFYFFAKYFEGWEDEK